MKRTTKITLSLATVFALGLVVLGLAGIVPGFPSQFGVQAAEDNDEKPITVDVACDCRTFKFNRGVPVDQSVRGDGFITNGKIFPAGTLHPGAQSNDPNDSGSTGTWVCRGTAAVSFAEILAGASHPFSFFTQYHMLDDGRVLVSEGFDALTEGRAAVVGGMGAFSGASGEISAVEIGTNSTGCPNIRFTINLKERAPK